MNKRIFGWKFLYSVVENPRGMGRGEEEEERSNVANKDCERSPRKARKKLLYKNRAPFPRERGVRSRSGTATRPTSDL